jgi:hypothetical protein
MVVKGNIEATKRNVLNQYLVLLTRAHEKWDQFAKTNVISSFGLRF